MRDPELTVCWHRRAYELPRQIAMYVTRQLTEASLNVCRKPSLGAAWLTP
jgi:chromosomal replication initiation ATPase DnaA